MYVETALIKDYIGNTANMGKSDTLFKDREPQKPYPIPRHVPV